MIKKDSGGKASTSSKKVPPQAKKADAAETKKQKAQTSAKNKTQESRDAARSKGRNSPISKSNPTVTAPTKSDPTKTIKKSKKSKGNDNKKTGKDKTSGGTPQTQPVTTTPPTSVSGDVYGIVKVTNDILTMSNLTKTQSASLLNQLMFEDLSAVELSLVLTQETVEGIKQRYSIISNLSEIRRKYSANKTLSNITRGFYATRFSIDINSKIPGDEYILKNGLDATYQYLDENNEIKTLEKGFLYIDTNGDLVIELDNIYPGENVEVQIDKNGTIYEVDI